MSSIEKFTCFEFIESGPINKVLIGSDIGSLYFCSFKIEKRRFDKFVIQRSTKYINLIDKTAFFQKRAKYNSHIRSISRINSEEYLIGCINGDLILYSFDKNESVFIKKGETNIDRIWRILVVNETVFITSGNYGRLFLFQKTKDGWIEKRLKSHHHAIFCLNKINENQFITNDYRGNNFLWTFDENFEISNIKIERTQGNMQNSTGITDNSFAMINKDGRIFLFEYSWDKYRKMTDFSLASGRGNDISYKDPYLICGTRFELIFIKPETLESSSIDKLECLQLKLKEGLIFFLSSTNLHCTLEIKSTLHEGQTIFKYAKIGLIGHTGVGKSSLCHYLKYGFPEEGQLKSTFGKQVWNLSKEEGYQFSTNQKILLYDLAGQVSSLYTSLPNLSDSDSIFVVFKQTDRNSLDIALNHLEELVPLLSDQCKLYLIQNFADHPNNDFEGYNFQSVLDKYGFKDLIQISSKEGNNIEKIKEILIQDIDWDNVRYMVHSRYETDVLNKIEDLSSTDLKENAMSSTDFDSQLGDDIWIPKQHLKYILKNLSRQGIIEYISELDRIIINDPAFNELQSVIPTYIHNNDGWCKTSEIFENLSRNNVNRTAYIRYHISTLISNLKAIIFSANSFDDEIIVIPSLLSDGDLNCINELQDLLLVENTKTLTIDECEFPWFSFLNYISSLNLSFGKLNSSNAIFYSKNKSFCFQLYLSKIIEDRLPKLEISIIYGGLNPQIVKKLAYQIQSFLVNLLPEVESEEELKFLESLEESKKNVSRTPLVYISYAYDGSDHISWVNSLADDLHSNGVAVLIDQWILYGGKDNVNFMKKMKQADKIILICDRNLIEKIEREESSGIQYEMRFINGRLLKEGKDCDSVIPIIKDEFAKNNLPAELATLNYIDFSNKEKYDEKMVKLIKSIWNQPNADPPPLGEVPEYILSRKLQEKK